MNKKEGKSGGGCVAASPIRDGITLLVVVCTPRVFLLPRLCPTTELWKGDCPALPPLAEQDDLAQPRTVGLLWFAWILMEDANRLAPGVMPMISPLRSSRPYPPQRTQQLSTSPPPCPVRDFRMMLIRVFLREITFPKSGWMMILGPSGPECPGARPGGQCRRPVQEAARRGRVGVGVGGTIATIIIIISSSCRSWVGSFA